MKKIILLFSFLTFAFCTFGQVKVFTSGATKVGGTTSNPAAGAKLQVTGGNTILSHNLGVGVTVPARQLHIAGPQGLARLDRSGGANAPGFLLANTDVSGSAVEKAFFVGVPTVGVGNGYFYVGDYGTSVSGLATRRFVVDNDGDVIIGSSTNTAAGFKLRVEGSAFKTDGQSQWNVLSDMKTKKNVKSFQLGLKDIVKLDPIKYQYNGKGGTKVGQQRIGVSAQDLKKVFPFMVNEFEYVYDDGLEDPDSEELSKTKSEQFLSINTSSLQWVMVNAIKEQQAQIDDLRLIIEDLSYKLDELKIENSENNDLDISLENGAIEEASVTVKPNPFIDSTELEVTIPSGSSSASVQIFNSVGKLLKTVSIPNVGKQTINIDATELSQGQYFYKLVVDGKQEVTNKMIKVN